MGRVGQKPPFAAASFAKVPWLTTEDRDAIRTLTMDVPNRKNAIPTSGWADLERSFADFEASQNRCLIVTGANGDFCAGADLDPGESVERSVSERHRRMKTVGRAAARLHRLTKPTIAAVDGVAVGAGMNLALGCDVVIASDRARFSEIFAARGLTLDFGGSWLLPRVVGIQRAKELALSARIVPADEAVEIGLCLEKVPVANLITRARALAASFIAQAPIAQMFTKQGLNQSWDNSFADALALEGVNQAICFTTADVTEGIDSFIEKRPPEFKGR